ncbi:MAG: hypothetical protein ACRDQ4_25490 [Pseudonocardiaceae bacterium]
MTDSSVAHDRASGFASFHATHATQADVLAMRVIGRSRRGADLLDVITYRDREFTLTFSSGWPGVTVPAIDTAGTMHNAAGRVTFSFHVIPLPQGRSLAAALTAYLDSTTTLNGTTNDPGAILDRNPPGWSQIRQAGAQRRASCSDPPPAPVQSAL